MEGVREMTIDSYLTMECNWTKKGNIDPEFRTPTLDETVEIACFKYGSTLGIRTSDTNTEMSDMTYLVKENVQVGDKIDNQIVRNVVMIPEFNGTEVLYEVHVMKA